MMATRFLTAALMVSATASLHAQTRDTVRLTLGGAARLAAAQNPQVIEAKFRVEQAQARVGTQRASLLPQLSADAMHNEHTLNTATFGIDFPTLPGQHAFFDPNGEIIGPVRLTD